MKRKSISLTVIPKDVIPKKVKELKNYLDKESYNKLLKRFDSSVGGDILKFSDEDDLVYLMDGKFKIVLETYPKANEVGKNMSSTKHFEKGDNISFDILGEIVSKLTKKAGEDILEYNESENIYYCKDRKIRIILEINIEKHNELFSNKKLEEFVRMETPRGKMFKELSVDNKEKTKVEIIPSFFKAKEEEQKVSYEQEDDEIEVL